MENSGYKLKKGKQNSKNTLKCCNYRKKNLQVLNWQKHMHSVNIFVYFKKYANISCTCFNTFQRKHFFLPKKRVHKMRK